VAEGTTGSARGGKGGARLADRGWRGQYGGISGVHNLGESKGRREKKEEDVAHPKKK